MGNAGACAHQLSAELARQGLDLVPNAAPTAVKKDPATGELTLETASGSPGPFDCVHMAVGRSPLIEPLSRDAAGGDTDAKGDERARREGAAR